MVRALFTEVKVPVGALGVALAALAPGLLLLRDTNPPVALAWGLIAFGIVVGSLALGSLYFAVTGFLERRRNSVAILDNWHCYYREKQVVVSVPLDIVSEASSARLECVAQLGQDVIPMKMSGQLTQSPFLRHRYVPDFVAHDVEVPEGVSMATITFSIQLSDGVFKKKTKGVPIQ